MKKTHHRKPGRKMNSGKYDVRLPGVAANTEIQKTLEEIAVLRSTSLASVMREILVQQAPLYLARLKQFNKPMNA